MSLLLGVAGCGGEFIGGPSGPGGGGGDDTPGGGDDDTVVDPPDAGPPPSFQMAIDPISAELALGETKAFTVTITPENGFTGQVTLASTGLLPSWQGTFDSPTIQVTDGAPVTATLTVSVPTDAEAGAAMIGASGQAAGLDKATPSSDITVKPELTIHIPKNSLDNPDNAFGPAGKLTVRYVAPGTKITWQNDDTVAHRIHADNVNGVDHEPNNMAAGGGKYTITVQAPGTYDYYCHIHPQMVGKLVVQ